MPRNPYYSGPPSDHFDGERFFLPGGKRTDKSRADLLRWQFGERNRPAWPASFPAGPADRPPERVEGAPLRVTHVGHASFLVQTLGVNLLIDPVWSERASPFQWLGPKRVNAPGIGFEDLPPLDAILVSHNHYDHMDKATLVRLVRQRPCPVLTPLGNESILRPMDGALEARAFDFVLCEHSFHGTDYSGQHLLDDLRRTIVHVVTVMTMVLRPANRFVDGGAEVLLRDAFLFGDVVQPLPGVEFLLEVVGTHAECAGCGIKELRSLLLGHRRRAVPPHTECLRAAGALS